MRKFIDECLQNGMGRMFSSKLIEDKNSIEKFQKISMRLNSAIVDMRLNNLCGSFAPECVDLYDSMVYKFGRSNRRQKYWKYALQVYAELKRINSVNLFDYFTKFAKAIENSNYSYQPLSSAVCFLGSLILEKILRLDHLRITCSKGANASMGYVELEHLLSFNLILISIASDVAYEAASQIRNLITIYDSLAEWFCCYSNKFPINSSEISLMSLNLKIPKEKPNMANVKKILQLLNTDSN